MTQRVSRNGHVGPMKNGTTIDRYIVKWNKFDSPFAAFAGLNCRIFLVICKGHIRFLNNFWTSLMFTIPSMLDSTNKQSRI